VTRPQLSTILSLLLLWACQRTPERAQPADDDHHEHDESDARSPRKHEHGDDLTRVHVHEGMLRDLHLTTQPVEARAAGDTISALGELRVNEERYAEIGTAIDARVTKVSAAPGDVVAAGQPLVELESLDVGRARAALASAQARLVLGRSTLERKRVLAGEQITSVRELQTAEAELAQTEAEHRAAQDALAALGAGKGAGARFVLSSPIAGKVLERTVLPGRRVDDSRALFILADLSVLWLVVHAFERDALRVREGAHAQVTFAALPGRTFGGRVARVGAQVDPVSRTVDVRIDLENAEGVLRPGMSATARIAIGEQDATIVTVPTHAVQRVSDSWAVFLPTQEAGAFEIRRVGRGRDLNGEVEIVSGLRADETVVVDGAFLLKAQVERARGGGEQHHH
jgi:cobalt-zinc-cadmium efflux system membrane fusion protein